ncbi:MAG: deoxyguanosinetriphosphate triphosphohydrolase [Actinomycetota bacterium]|nr:MAG: deoxyguanosinetriphosphate triphosphohydrolase [Actinomycetota bacterium]
MTPAAESDRRRWVYADADQQRWVAEEAKRPGRSAFARDRARVLHSAALRRLAAKTQVVLAGRADFPRTRLTHTLEVAQIARELGQSLGCDPDLAEVAGLAHDLGHPPFGHNGEKALAEVAAAYGGFEGNAQSFRVLTRLEAKSFAGGRSAGLNLTRASLDATAKYPWPVRPGSSKFGVYADDLEVFDWVRQSAPDGRRCLEAQVMDWADDVAYSVHDVEDAVHGGHVRLPRLAEPADLDDLLALARDRYAPDVEVAELGDALDRLRRLPFWPTAYDGSQRALAALKNLTSELIGRFSYAAQDATRAAFGGGPLARYDADLVVPRQTRLEVAVMKGVAGFYVIEPQGTGRTHRRQREVLAELVSTLWHDGGSQLEPWLRPAWDSAGDDAARLRVVVDQVASLTDVSAVAWHDRLCRNGASTADRRAGGGAAERP